MKYFFFKFKKKKLVGVCSTRINQEYLGYCCSKIKYNSGYIMTLGVSPTFRRRGIASDMIRESESTLISKFKCKKLTLHCKGLNILKFIKKKLTMTQLFYFTKRMGSMSPIELWIIIF
jgi:GNAT superfamily N-acetyltransferase